MFLSPKYEVVRFKKTNVFLNRIYVKARLDDNLDTVFKAKNVAVEEAVFMKDRSVFKDYREDNEVWLKKCFEFDINYGKIGKFMKKDPYTFERIKDCMFQHYAKLLDIFDFYSGTSDFPRISYNDITSFSNHTGILDQNYINLAAFDLLLVATNVVDGHKFKVSAENNICRYEFLEFIIRTAMFRYMEKDNIRDHVLAIDTFIEEYLYPNCRIMNGERFRKFFCYNVATNEVIKKNEVNLMKLYKSFTHSKQKYVKLDQLKPWCRKLNV